MFNIDKGVAMFDLFDIQFNAIGIVRLDKRLSDSYLTQFIKIKRLQENAYSFDNLSHLVGKELARQKSSMLTEQDELQCSIDAFDIIDSLNVRFNLEYV